MKVLITGVTGLVGRHLCHKLSKNYEILSLVRSEQKFRSIGLQGSVIKGDLSEFSWVESLPEDLDVVIHVAGVVHSHNEKDFEDINYKGTEKLIKFLHKRYKKLKFILISSQAAAGPSDILNRPVDEMDLPTPVSAYGKSKLGQEKVLLSLAPSWQKIIIRPPMVIGPGDDAFVDVFKPVAKGVKIYIGKAGKDKEYSFVCVYDLVETIALSLEKSFAHEEVFYSAFPETITYQELLREIEVQIKIKGREIVIPSFLLPIIAYVNMALYYLFGVDIRLTRDKIHEIRPKKWICNSFKSQDVLGQRYHWNLSKTIQATLDDFSKRGLL